MELLIWFVNSNIGDAFSTGIIGLVFGPVYPAVLSLATALLPQEVHLVTMGLMSVSYPSKARNDLIHIYQISVVQPEALAQVRFFEFDNMKFVF